jgi:hypothetical protein
MATSGVTTLSLTGDQLVNAALRKIAVLGDGQSPSATQLANGTQALNVMLKTFMTQGMPLWVIGEYSLTLTATRTYTFGIGQTVAIPAPLKVHQVIRETTASGSRVPLNVRTHYDYNLLSNNSSSGPPIAYWYEPLNQTGVLHVWPLPDATTIAGDTLTVVYQKPFQDMVSGTDTLDFPQWWQEAVIYGLAWRLSPEFGVPLSDRKTLAGEAQLFLDTALSFGTEEGSLFLQPDWTMYGC